MLGRLSIFALGVSQITESVQPTVVDIGHENRAAQVAVLTCVGLMNRKDSGMVPAYVFGSSADVGWLQDTEGIVSPEITPVPEFLAMCLQAGGPAKGYIRYNASNSLVLPNVITMAAVLDAVPLEDGDSSATGATLVFDAVTTFAGFDARDATEYVYENHVNQTTTMSKMDPGWVQTQYNPLKPTLTGTMRVGLTDYIVKERLFNFYMYHGCVPNSTEHALFERMVTNNPWPKPIVVMGYDKTVPLFGGDLFEAETLCAKEHNLGQIASEGTMNLAYFSRKPRIDSHSPLLQNADPPQARHNRSKVYVSFLLGDGDNLNFVKNARKEWMQERLARCAADPAGCFPLVWTISPQLLHLAPDWMRWFYNASHQTGRDYFVLPPSGDLYAYPGEMPADSQANFVTNTENDCKAMNTSGVVTWEFMFTWKNAIDNFFPQYAKNGIVRGLIPVNVPYLIPVFDFKPWQNYKIFDKTTVLFRPREWRGAGASKFNKQLKSDTAQEMADEINNYKKGSASAIYMTSDGGLNFDLMYDMVQYLGEHVEIVSHNTLVDMALADRLFEEDLSVQV